MKLHKAIDVYIEYAEARRLSPHTIRDYSTTFHKLLAYLGNINMEDITAHNITKFLGAQNGISEKTLLNYHIGLSALWSWAHENGYASTHLLKSVPRPKAKKTVIQPYTTQEIRAMLSAVGKTESYTRNGSKPTTHTTKYANRNRALILVLLDTGLRASEICNAQIELLNQRERRLTVTGKGNKVRNVFFSGGTMAAILKYIEGRVSGPLFLSGERAMHRDELYKTIRRIGNRAGVRGATVHRFRHTFAILYLRNNGRPWHLKELLGHSTMDMVNNYLELSQIDLQDDHRTASPVDNLGL